MSLSTLSEIARALGCEPWEILKPESAEDAQARALREATAKLDEVKAALLSSKPLSRGVNETKNRVASSEPQREGEKTQVIAAQTKSNQTSQKHERVMGEPLHEPSSEILSSDFSSLPPWLRDILPLLASLNDHERNNILLPDLKGIEESRKLLAQGPAKRRNSS
jgi:hypothetical protein